MDAQDYKKLLEFSDRARRLGVSDEILMKVFLGNPSRAYAIEG